MYVLNGMIMDLVLNTFASTVVETINPRGTLSNLELAEFHEENSTVSIKGQAERKYTKSNANLPHLEYKLRVETYVNLFMKPKPQYISSAISTLSFVVTAG